MNLFPNNDALERELSELENKVSNFSKNKNSIIMEGENKINELRVKLKDITFRKLNTNYSQRLDSVSSKMQLLLAPIKNTIRTNNLQLVKLKYISDGSNDYIEETLTSNNVNVNFNVNDYYLINDDGALEKLGKLQSIQTVDGHNYTKYYFNFKLDNVNTLKEGSIPYYEAYKSVQPNPVSNAEQDKTSPPITSEDNKPQEAGRRTRRRKSRRPKTKRRRSNRKARKSRRRR